MTPAASFITDDERLADGLPNRRRTGKAIAQLLWLRLRADPANGSKDLTMKDLEHLISAYFYELWDECEYSSWQEAVDDFVRRSPDRAMNVPVEIAALLADGRSDDALAAQLEEWGFDAQTPNGERAWLLGVREQIASDLAAEAT
jgi:hypothetical protein